MHPLPFIQKPRPAKAALSPRVRHSALRFANHLQVLGVLAPASVEFLEHLAADLRTRAELSVKQKMSS